MAFNIYAVIDIHTHVEMNWHCITSHGHK